MAQTLRLQDRWGEEPLYFIATEFIPLLNREVVIRINNHPKRLYRDKVEKKPYTIIGFRKPFSEEPKWDYNLNRVLPHTEPIPEDFKRTVLKQVIISRGMPEEDIKFYQDSEEGRFRGYNPII